VSLVCLSLSLLVSACLCAPASVWSAVLCFCLLCYRSSSTSAAARSIVVLTPF
jgi:hypothetical protein